jgi:hypothetical protein
MKYCYEIHRVKCWTTYYDTEGNEVTYEKVKEGKMEISGYCRDRTKSEVVKRFSKMKDAKLFLNNYSSFIDNGYSEHYDLCKVELE